MHIYQQILSRTHTLIALITSIEGTASMTKRTTIEKSNLTRLTTDAATSPLTVADRLYLRFGYPAVRGLHLLATVLGFGLVLVIDYLIVLFTAVNVLPNIAALVQKGTGITVDMRIDAVIAGWLIPVLFIVAALLVGEIVVMRRLWRFASERLFALARWLLRLPLEKWTEEKRAAQDAKYKASPQYKALEKLRGTTANLQKATLKDAS
jgi:hypothetical protein